MKKIFILFSLIFIMLIFLSLSFVQAQEYQQSIGPAGCTKTGAFITISGFFSGSTWENICYELCGTSANCDINVECVCESGAGIRVCKEVNTASLESLRNQGGIGMSLANIVQYTANPLVEACRRESVEVLDILKIDQYGKINSGKLVVLDNNIKIGRMINKQFLPEVIGVSGSEIDFTNGYIILTDTGIYTRIVEDVCEIEPEGGDTLIIKPSIGYENVVISFSDEREVLGLTRTSNVFKILWQKYITRPPVVAILSSVPYYCYYKACSGGKTFLANPATINQYFAMILKGNLKPNLCSSSTFTVESASFSRQHLPDLTRILEKTGEDEGRCINIINGDIILSQKMKEEAEYEWKTEITPDGYYNIDALGMRTGSIKLSEAIIITSEGIFGEGISFKNIKGKTDEEIKAEITII